MDAPNGNIPVIIGAFDPGIVWNEAENFVYADKSPYIGVDAVLAGLFARLGGEWDGFSAVQIVDGGDTVVAPGRSSEPRASASGFPR